jgi:hypothetical protein
MVQVNSKTKDVTSSKVSILGSDNKVLVSKVINKGLANSENWSLG